MGFKLTHLILFLVVYTLNTSTTVFAAVNVTINYQDSSITYSPPGAWSQSAPSTLDLGGAHMITKNPNATASFNFTGKFFSSPQKFISLFFFFLSFLFFFFQVDFCLFYYYYYHICFILSRHRDILFSSIVALCRQYCRITRFWAYQYNRFRGSHRPYFEYLWRPRDRSISSRLACYWIS